MSVFSVRDGDENIVASYVDFEEAWNHLQIDLSGNGDIVEKEDDN